MDGCTKVNWCPHLYDIIYYTYELRWSLTLRAHRTQVNSNWARRNNGHSHVKSVSASWKPLSPHWLTHRISKKMWPNTWLAPAIWTVIRNYKWISRSINLRLKPIRSVYVFYHRRLSYFCFLFTWSPPNAATFGLIPPVPAAINSKPSIVISPAGKFNGGTAPSVNTILPVA